MSFESALSYAALILADAEIEISADNLLALTKVANIEIEGIYADLFSKALEGQDIKALLTNFSAGAAPATGGAVSAASGEAAGEAAAEEKEEEAKEESDDDMGFGLFD
ncbi:CYFA0S18e00848g1_1 [Cyberlindnera fabianii]|uniref:CYFA0S18e00848g1_1 n=1 Tax=Cyberlindnera fabianii TaxID=36022 RepID=A0A061B699_CYBFA|nr:CYFA0S18e00848g1_1 [Cyberlindnera fabianii]